MPRVRLPQNVVRLVAPLVVSLVVDYSASRRLVVDNSSLRSLAADYFASAAHSGASSRRAFRRLARCAARHRLLRLRHASGCLGMSRGPSWLVVDYSVRHDFVLRPHWLYFSHAVRGDYLSRGNTGSTSSTPRAAMMSSSSRIASTIHLD
jgi:hypothetical protein